MGDNEDKQEEDSKREKERRKENNRNVFAYGRLNIFCKL